MLPTTSLRTASNFRASPLLPTLHMEDSRLRIVHDYDDRCLPMSTTTLPDGERVTTEWYPMVIYVPGVLRVTSSGISSAADSSLEDSSKTPNCL